MQFVDSFRDKMGFLAYNLILLVENTPLMRVLYGVMLTSGFPNRHVSNYLNSLLH